MKKLFKAVLSLFAAAACVLPFAACGNEQKAEDEPKSQIFGTFTYIESLGVKAGELNVTSRTERISGRRYLKSTVYPLDNIDSQPIKLVMDQRLKLSKDFTYKYDYSIKLSSPLDWGKDVGTVSVSISGTFEYRGSEEDGLYSILLSDPVSGKQTVTAPKIYGTGSTNNWETHGSPDMVIDYGDMYGVEGFVYDSFVCAKTVAVSKKDKKLFHDIFSVDIFDYIIRYSEV